MGVRRYGWGWAPQRRAIPSSSPAKDTKAIRRSARHRIHSMTASSQENCCMNLTLEEISKAIGGRLEGSGSVRVRGYSIDSRTLNAGELFFAIKGPRFDGHRFLQQVAEKKAAAAVVEQSSAAAFDERSGGHQ